MSKILYAAGTMDHIRSFHMPYINALREDGHEVLVMAKGKDADFNIGFVKKMLSSQNTSCRRKIKKILKTEKFDAVILNTTLAAFHIRLAMPKKNRPMVINFVHGYMFPNKVETLKERIFFTCERFLSKKTDSVIVMNSEDYKSATENKFCLGEVRMVRGMGASVAEMQVSKESICKFTESEGKYIICFVGELYKAKNQRMLICALPEIQLEIPNAVLWLVGEGVDRHELVELTEDLNLRGSVVFIGKRLNPCDYMRAADLYVSASEKEGLPFNIMEALGCGKTVLASDIKGHRDIIEDGVSGFLYQPSNIYEFVNKVKAIYRGEMSIDPNAAVARFDNFSFDSVFAETYDVIKELVENDREA